MRPEDVPGEWVQAAKKGWWSTESGGEIAMAHALAAVAPMIAAQERERCAVIAENHEWFVGGIGTTAPGSGQAKAIAVALRALP